MGVGGYDGFVALAKEVRRAQKAQAERLERRRQQVEERRNRLYATQPIDEGPVDDMACPSCGQRFSFGDNCPDCGDALVCEAMLDAERTVVREHKTLGSYPVLGLLLVGAATFLFVMGCAGFFGGCL
jgi:hypothetical protein